MAKRPSSIKKRLLASSITALNKTELATYLAYRIENLTCNNPVLLTTELEYLLCDCGHGRLRFDPELVRALLATVDSTNSKFTIKPLGVETAVYSTIFSPETLETIMTQKTDLVRLIRGSISKPYYYSALGAMLDKLSRLANMTDIAINLYQTHIRLSGQISGNRVLIGFYPNSWLYPYSSEIWSLRKDAAKTGATPIVLAKRIHGVSFPMFKVNGIIGFNSYASFLPERTITKIESYNSTTLFPEIPLKIESKMRIGHLECLESVRDDIDTEIYEGYPLRNFFERVLPDYLQKIDNSETLNGSHFEKLEDPSLETSERLELFLDSIRQIRSQKVRKNLRAWTQWRIAILSK